MDVDVVVIGINCAKVLPECIESIRGSSYAEGVVRIIYVDGGSIDNTLQQAASYDNVQTLALTPQFPAPGLQRNAGWRAGKAPFVLFLDADTTLDSEFISRGVHLMQQEDNARLGAVFGTRRERRPDASVYNWLGDLEWNPELTVSDGSGLSVESFGGDVFVRREALEETNGYDEVLVGGEDPELGVRFGLAGWEIRHIGDAMTQHDLATFSLVKHSRRAFRTGYGFAAVALRHAGKARGFWLHELVRILLRGGGGITCLLLALQSSGLLLMLFLTVAFLLLLYPRLFSISKLMHQKGLTRAQAQKYAWHCAFIVIPQFFGVLRFFIGSLIGKPLRNSALRVSSLLLLLVFLLPVVGCSPRVQPKVTESWENAAIAAKGEQKSKSSFTTEAKKLEQFTTIDAIIAFSADVPKEYLLGPGDVISLEVWNRPSLSDTEIVVAPDGAISVMRIGFVQVKGRSVEDVTGEVVKRFSAFYSDPEVRITVRKYRNNKAFVLGRVTNPGLVEFSGRGTLLEALSLAGGLPILSQKSFLTKCAIIRGKDQVIWIDLRELLQNGNMELNTQIKNNDIIFIPESEDELIYVMGEVEKPGAIHLKSKLTYLDALMFSGGPTSKADLEKTFIIRFDAGERNIKKVNLKKMLEEGDGAQNFVLKDNDVLYVAETGMASFNHTLKQLMPALEVLNLGTSVMERFGVMQDLRRRWYGTDGFVNGE